MNPLKVPVQLEGINGDKVVKFYRGLFDTIAKEAEQSFSKIKSPLTTGVTRTQVSTSRSSGIGSQDAEMQKAMANIRKMEAERVSLNRSSNNAIRASNKTLYDIRIGEIKSEERAEKAKINSILAEMKKLGNETKNLSGISSGNGLLGSIIGGNLITQGITRITTSLTDGGAAILDYSAKLQQAKIGFTTLVGSTQLAEKHLKDLQNFAKTTPFEFPDLVQASRRLQGVGIAAERVIPILTSVGNAAAAAGNSSEEIQGITVALSQVIAKGKVAAQEVNQFAERGIPIWSALSEATGKSRGELVKLAEQGALSSELLLQTFEKIYGEGSKFGDAMEKQSKTFNGALSNIKDALYQTSAEAFKPLFERVSTLAVDMANDINSQGSDFNAVGQTMGKYIVAGFTIALKEGLYFVISSGLSELKALVTLDLENFFLTGRFTKLITEGVAKGLGLESYLRSGTLGETVSKGVQASLNAQNPIEFRRFDPSKVGQNNNLLEIGQSKTKSGSTAGSSRLANAGIDEFASNRIKAQYQTALRNLSPGLKAQISLAAEKYGIPEALAFAQIFSESSFNTKAVSPFNANVGSSAFGLTQQLPQTASRVLKKTVTGEQLKNNPQLALSAWGEYMTFLFERYGDWELATLAYHQGEGTVDKLVKVLDKEGNAGSFFKGRPKGKAYVQKIAALSGIRGDDQFQYAKPSTPSVSMIESSISTEFIGRELDLQSKFILGLEEAYKINERSQTLNDKQLYFQQEVNALITDYDLALQERLQKLSVETRIISARNLELEQSVRFAEEQNNQFAELIDLEVALNVLKQQNADDQFKEQRRLLGSRREEFNLQKQITDLQDELASQGVNDSLKIQAAYLQDILELRNRELNAVIDINRAQLELSQQTKISQNEIRANVLSALAAQKDLNQAISDGIIALGEKTTDFLNKKLGKFADIPLLGDLAKFANQQVGANISKTVLDIFFPGKVDAKTGNPVLDENIKQTTYLKRISDAVTGQTVGGVPIGTGGGGALGAVGTLLGLGGGNLGNRTGINSPYILNANSANSNLSLHEMTHASGSNNILSQLFGKGGIFGSQGFGNNVGTYGTIGAGASLLGSLIGGRTGSTISGAGAGLGIGAQIGSIIPGVGTAIGAGVGAVVGGLIGLFTGGKRREEEGIRDKAMVQTLSQLNQIKSGLDARPPTVDWQSGLNQAKEISTAYFNAMGQLTDSKTRGIALKDGRERVGEINNPMNTSLLYKIQASADSARAWQINRQNTQSQFTGEFANGVYVSEQFKRYNGMLGGVYSGRDYIKALIGDGEMVLNPRQIQAVRNRAGFDAFADAGIPNYRPKAEIPKFNSGISFNTPTASSNPANNNVTVIIEHNEKISEARVKEISINGVKQKINTGGRN